MRGIQKKAYVGLGLCMVFATACSAGGYSDENNQQYYDYGYGSPGNNYGGYSDMSAGYNSDQGSQEPFIPEIEEDFDFSQPAVIGSQIFVANETLNSVAVIDSENLAIRTIPVGFGPTMVVGPQGADTVDDSRVAVLNEGSYTVSLIEPSSDQSLYVSVMRGANSLVANRSATSFVAWYDDSLNDGDATRGDLSSISLIRGDMVYQIAVGFHVRDVFWSTQADQVVVVSDDGVSLIDITNVEDDQLSAPVAVLPQELVPLNPEDLEILVDQSGRYALARLASFSGLVVTELESGVQHVFHLPEIPTDIDFVNGDVPKAMVMLPYSKVSLVLEMSSSLSALADIFAPEEEVVQEDVVDMGMDMAQSEDMVVVEDMTLAPDMLDLDMLIPDMLELDMGSDDMAQPEDMAMLEDMSMEADMEPVDMAQPEDMADVDSGNEVNWAAIHTREGVSVIFLPEDERLGAAVISENGKKALLYTTIAAQSRIGVLYDFDMNQQDAVYFEKGVKSVVGDEDGESFVVFHQRDESNVNDPVASSWGISVVDVRSATPRLVITEHEPWVATLWSTEGLQSRAYIIFKRPVDESFAVPSHRDVLSVNLKTFRADSFRVPSLPEGIGAIGTVGKVYVDQKHPQGRMTFVDVASDKRQTITGYQLNAGID